MKNCSKTFHSSLLAYLIKGAILFALLSVSYYVYAAITYPPQPNPASGVVGLYVGKTANGPYNGGVAKDYETANGYCSSEFDNSHVCTPMEIVNTYNHEPGSVPSTGRVWLNSGAPANTSPSVNDCKGWTVGDNSRYGNVWFFDGDFSGILPCDWPLQYACCR